MRFGKVAFLLVLFVCSMVVGMAYTYHTAVADVPRVTDSVEVVASPRIPVDRPHFNAVPVPRSSHEHKMLIVTRAISRVRPNMDASQLNKAAQAYIAAEQEYGIRIEVLLAKDYVESRYNAKATSYTDRGNPIARGWAQFTEPTGRAVWKELGWQWEGPTSLFDMEKSIFAGAHYLKELLVRYKGDFELALVAYNMGPTRLDGIIRAKGRGGVPSMYYDLVNAEYIRLTGKELR